MENPVGDAETFKPSVLESDIASGRQEQKMCGRVLVAESDAVKLFRRPVAYQEVGFSYGYSSRLYVIISTGEDTYPGTIHFLSVGGAV